MPARHLRPQVPHLVLVHRRVGDAADRFAAVDLLHGFPDVPPEAVVTLVLLVLAFEEIHEASVGCFLAVLERLAPFPRGQVRPRTIAVPYLVQLLQVDVYVVPLRLHRALRRHDVAHEARLLHPVVVLDVRVVGPDHVPHLQVEPVGAELAVDVLGRQLPRAGHLEVERDDRLSVLVPRPGELRQGEPGPRAPLPELDLEL
mmetsp:Transcript_12403/g.35140  ORF Transcript_12403/g.35140 Transcript_12403/m.35140 type:complete len:201 (+) Transcript_12403:110-712(+)